MQKQQQLLLLDCISTVVVQWAGGRYYMKYRIFKIETIEIWAFGSDNLSGLGVYV